MTLQNQGINGKLQPGAGLQQMAVKVHLDIINYNQQ